MTQTLNATFDGKSLHFDAPLKLPPNTRCKVTVEVAEESDKNSEANPWDEIAKLAGTVEGPADMAAEHDHYIHGTPKRSNEKS
ncbi:MAG TPA: hypothetical protein VEK08_19050 [Planctomycetota bacterium]|nr:hypothetical protein [Planctomycetota bacterium]